MKKDYINFIRDIIGMRNIIIHSYDKVDPKQLWNTIKYRLKPLEDNLNKMLAELEVKE